jgi:hypothetical protein
LNVSLPFSLHSGNVLLIVAALGAVAGLSLFFHGFSLLQQRWPTPVHRPAKIAVPPVTTTADTPGNKETSSGADGPIRETRSARSEVIKLTPHDNGEISSASMTQQGRIAAALLKAGIPSPATWSTGTTHTTVRTEDPVPRQPSPATDAEVSRVLQQGATASEFRIPALNQTAPRHPSNWEATLMIWGGPALTLACIYILAAHLGWL